VRRILGAMECHFCAIYAKYVDVLSTYCVDRDIYWEGAKGSLRTVGCTRLVAACRAANREVSDRNEPEVWVCV